MVLPKSKFLSPLVCAALLISGPCNLEAQEPGAPATANPADLNRLFGEADAAFTAKDYETAAAKLEDLLKAVGASKEGPVEMLRFNLGLAYLLAEKPAEAEKAFTNSVTQFPKGEYTSRSYLGIGQACIAQGEAKLERAVEALKRAASDPKYRTEAGLTLGKVYTQLNKPEEALTVFRSLMGSDVRSPQQTNAAVEVIGVLAETKKIDDLVPYLDRLINQPGVRDSLAWYANQVIVKADNLTENSEYDAALAIYRSVPPRRQILENQRTALDGVRKDLAVLEKRVADEEKLPLGKRSNASELLADLKSALTISEEALKAIDGKADLDAALLMRRGRCLYHLRRYEEALVCFRTIRTKYPEATDLQTAAYAEISVQNQLKNTSEVQSLANAYLRKFPDAKNSEQVAVLAVEGLARENKWLQVLQAYQELEKKFPQSPQLDRYIFLQGVALFSDGQFAESAEVFTKFMTNYPNSELFEDALYRIAMANFLTNEYKATLEACQEYLKRHPDGRYAGDITYRLAFIDFNDKEKDQSDNIIRNLNTYLDAHPNDPAAGMMLNLMGDVYSQKKPGSENLAVDAYKRAIWSKGQDEVIRYAVESATSILQSQKDWAGLAALHAEILKEMEGSDLSMVSASWMAKMKVREGKGPEAAEILAKFLRTSLGDPENEQVELLIDELVKTLIPLRKKPADINFDEINTQLVDVLNRAAQGMENPTTNARIYYARARLAQMLKHPDKANLFLKGIATTTEDPASLSPALLAVSGEVLLKEGDLDKAEAMFRRLADRFKEGQFADAGPVGLGQVALARKNYEEALKMFSDSIENSPGMSRFKEATLGKLKALIELGRYPEAEQLGLETVSDKSFRGEGGTARATLLLGELHQKRASTQNGKEQKESLAKANGYYQRVYLTQKAYPEVCAEAYWRSYEILTELGEADIAKETLRNLSVDPKLQNTERAKKAKEMSQ